MKKANIKKTNIKKEPESKGKYILFEVVLIIYILLTIAFITLFEYRTVSVSGGEIIFSLSMSWQVILFAVELITIIVQLVMMLKLHNGYEDKKYKILRNTGIAAFVCAFAAVIGLIFADGFVLFPTVVFMIYGIIILLIRVILMPGMVMKSK